MSDDVDKLFKEAWMYCMLEHGVATLVSGPCNECIAKFAQPASHPSIDP